MKTEKELNDLKEEIEIMGKKLNVLTDEELSQVSGGGGWRLDVSLCSEDCLGRCHSWDCPYSYCKFNRW